jgi:hypothetical protein
MLGKKLIRLFLTLVPKLCLGTHFRKLRFPRLAKQSFAEVRSQTGVWERGKRGKKRILLAVCFLPACQQQMATQPSYRPDEPSSFFSDGRVARPLVPGTVARGHLRTDFHLYAGSRMAEGSSPAGVASLLGVAGAGFLSLAPLVAAQGVDDANAVDAFPFPVTEQVLKHGQNRYMIYCAPCHDALGTGRGMIVERGYTPPPSFHIERLRQAPVGHFFQVITKGYGSMPSYKKQVPPSDRWAIIAYLRALQLSQHFPLEGLPDDLRHHWDTRQAAAQLAPKTAGGKP